MPEFAARKLFGTCKRFSLRFYKVASERIMETDRKMKSSADDNGRLLEMLIMELAQEARND
jgi:DNA polymerase III delta subunit